MARVVLLNKPFDVMCQFTDDSGRTTLADFVSEKGVYPAGRLDRDSEGLVVLTDDGALQAQISSPKFKKPKTYWVQVDGDVTDEALNQLRQGVELKDGLTKPAHAKKIGEPKNLWPRNPPVRFRKSVPTSWIELTLKEGKNRQVRRMTAAVGFPTLRLIRAKVGDWSIEGLGVGETRTLEVATTSKAKRAPTHGKRAPSRKRVNRG